MNQTIDEPAVHLYINEDGEQMEIRIHKTTSKLRSKKSHPEKTEKPIKYLKTKGKLDPLALVSHLFSTIDMNISPNS
jgi:hypothetical protein